MGRFINTKLDEWEEFSYTFTLGDNFLYNSTGKIRRLFLMVQASNRFYGRVLLDDFKVQESYEFYPDVDVRKKISTGVYGKADLTKYYDEELQPDEYKDSTAPLEAQFYFYPTYPTDEIFDVKRTPIYDDFRKGLFYIKDVEWGDGTPIEFSEPEKIDDSTALYHTYESSGIFEVTGLMIRKKIDSAGEELGAVHVKKFRLRISINEGVAEDFNYFGGSGFSFIPFKSNFPIIGGISKQSSYYKSIKRQLGFIGDSKSFVKFNLSGDKLKTELALLKMENQSNDNLEIVPTYLEKRFIGAEYILPHNGGAGAPTTITWPYGEYLLNGHMPFIPRYENLQPDEPGGDAHSIYYIRMTNDHEKFATWNVGQQMYTGPLADINYLEFGQTYDFYVWQQTPGTTNEYGEVIPPQDGFINLMGEFPLFFPNFEQEPITKINNGINPLREIMGSGIGDCDLTSIKYYNTPKSIWELFGFKEEDLEQIATPNNERYWKNIIPKDYNIFHRDGVADFTQVSPSYDILKQYHLTNDASVLSDFYDEIIDGDQVATSTFEFLQIGEVPTGNIRDVGSGVEGWNGNNFNERFLMGFWNMSVVEIDDLPGYEKAIRIVTRYSENSPYDNMSWGGFYRAFNVSMEGAAPTMFGGWFKVLNGGMEYGALNTANRISRTPDYGNPNNGWEFFVSPLNESYFQSDSEGNGVHFYSWINESNPDGEVLIAGLFAFNDEEFFTNLHDGVVDGIPQDYESGLNVYSIRNIVDTYAQQDWFGDYYYPILPKYGQDGKFIEGTIMGDSLILQPGLFTWDIENSNTIIWNHENLEITTETIPSQITQIMGESTVAAYQNGIWEDSLTELINGEQYTFLLEGNESFTWNRVTSDFKTPFPLNGAITDENEIDENLLVNITKEEIENNVMDDKSGNNNYGFSISDYKPTFDKVTLKPLKQNKIDTIKKSNRRGAF